MGIALTTSRFSVRTSKNVRLIHDINISIASGERVGILGRSGSGKSLLAASLSGTLDPTLITSGHITLMPADTGDELREIGFGSVLVQQDSSDALNPSVKVGKQLALPLKRSTNAKERLKALIELVESMGLAEDILDKYPPELSGGQRQRACIAMALACDASMLIADESTTALDSVSEQQVLQALRVYASRACASIIFITHDLAVAAQICDRILLIHEGTVVVDQSLAKFLAAPEHPIAQALVTEARTKSLRVSA